MKTLEFDFRQGSMMDNISKTLLVSQNSPVFRKTNKGTAMTFNGINQRVYAANNTIGNITTGNFSLEIWIKINRDTPEYFFSKGAAGVTPGFTLFRSGGNLLCSLMDAGGSVNYTFGALSKNVRHHIIVTFNRTSNIVAYINSVASAPQSIATKSGSLSNTQTLSIGAFSGNSDYTNCSVLLARQYDTVLTQQEVTVSYKEFLNTCCILETKRNFEYQKPTDLSFQKNNTLTNIYPTINFQSGWSAFGGASVTSSTKLQLAAASSGAFNSSILMTLGRKYTIAYKMKAPAGNSIRFRDGAVSSTNYAELTMDGTFKEGVITYDAVSPYTQGFSLSIGIGQPGGELEIEYLRIFEYSGLVAAYNMVANKKYLVDVSSNNNIGTFGTIYPDASKTGLRFNGTQRANLATDINLGTTHTISFRCTPNLAANKIIIGNQGDSVSFLYIDGFGAIGYRVNNNTVLSTAGIIKINIPQTVTLVRTGVTVAIYVNGVFIENITVVAGDTMSFNQLFARQSGVPFSGDFEDLRFYNRAISLQEVKDYHNSFCRVYIKDSFKELQCDSTTKLPMGRSPGTGVFKGGEITIAPGDKATNGSFTGSATGWGLGNRVYGNNKISINLPTGNSNVVQTIASTFELNKLYRIKITISNYVKGGLMVGFGANPYTFSQQLTGNGIFTIDIVNLYAGSILLIQAQSGGTGVELSVDDISISEISPLDTITTGTKYLECTTAGTLVQPSNMAYGTREFDFYRGGGSEFRFNFMSGNMLPYDATGAGYMVYVATQINLYKVTGTIIAGSASAYIQIGVWYRIRITRTVAGVFTVLLKGGSLVPTAGYDGWTLMSVTGGTGTNPATENAYTTSKFLVLDPDVGDRFTNLYISNDIKK